MVHEFTQVRAGVLRTLRYTLKTSRDIQLFNELQLPLLLCRSIDIVGDNEEERVQAFKLVSNSIIIMMNVLSSNILKHLKTKTNKINSFECIRRYEKSCL